MPTSITDARQLLQKVAQEWWASNARPILGSQLKAKMLSHAPDFNEQDLGYRNFASFVRDAEGLALQFRGTTDFAVVPVQHESALTERIEKQVRIRNDFWQAFVGFAVPNQMRAYDQAADKIIKGPANTIPPGAIPIIPIAKEHQLLWRRHFIESLGPESPLSGLIPDLRVDGGFRKFSGELESRPDLRRRWHAALANHVVAVIRDWAKPINLPDSVWLSQEIIAPEPSDIVRKRVYELLDTITVEQLLELKLPLRSLLDIPSMGGKSRAE